MPTKRLHQGAGGRTASLSNPGSRRPRAARIHGAAAHLPPWAMRSGIGGCVQGIGCVRLVDRRHASWRERIVRRVTLRSIGSVGSLQNDIEHYSYNEIADQARHCSEIRPTSGCRALARGQANEPNRSWSSSPPSSSSRPTSTTRILRSVARLLERRKCLLQHVHDPRPALRAAAPWRGNGSLA